MEFACKRFKYQQRTYEVSFSYRRLLHSFLLFSLSLSSSSFSLSPFSFFLLSFDFSLTLSLFFFFLFSLPDRRSFKRIFMTKPRLKSTSSSHQKENPTVTLTQIPFLQMASSGQPADFLGVGERRKKEKKKRKREREERRKIVIEIVISLT